MIFGEKHQADGVSFCLDHVGPQALDAEYVRNKAEVLAKERKWRELVGVEFWGQKIRSSTIGALISGGRLWDKCRSGRNRHRRKIGRGSDAGRHGREEG